MSSTNKTSNYELSQFIGTDRPAWLADYNTDMSKIDAQMKLNADSATSASGTATSASTAIGTLANLTTDAKTNLVVAINEVDGHADTAQGTATDAYALATSVNTNLNNFIGQFNFTTTQYNATTPNDRSISNNAAFSSDSGSSLAVAIDSAYAMFKCYGRQNITVSSTGNVTITLPVTGLTVDSSYDIMGAGSAVNGDGTKILEVQPVTLTVSNGQIQVKFSGNRTGLWNIWCTPSLYFNTDFGD